MVKLAKEEKDAKILETDPSEEDMETFFHQMREGIKGHFPLYGSSWRQMSKGKMYDRLKHKMTEFDLTFNPNKLVSMANLAMLLYFKFTATPVKSQNPDEML